MTMVTKAGFYGGVFKKAGQTTDVEIAEPKKAVDLDAMSKDELIAEAERRQVEVKVSDTKAEIVAALKAAAEV